MARLYTRHPQALVVLHGDLENHARAQAEVFVGTPGSVVERENAGGFRFHAHQYYDALGKRRERYLAGPVGQEVADAIAAALWGRIRETAELAATVRLVGREGFAQADARTFAVVASLHNHGLFRAGAVLVGSHAYGVLLNQLGVRGAPYATEDVDLARPRALDFEVPPSTDLAGMLAATGLEFFAIPGLGRKDPSTSYALLRRKSFHVDLLAPARGTDHGFTAVAELAAHAAALPHLGFLVGESQPGLLMTRTAVCAVRVPLPERFAVHKLIVSQLRSATSAKASNDLTQAAVLAAAVGEAQPGALAAAVAAAPVRARKYLVRALPTVQSRLEADHPQAWEELAASVPSR